ncbi:UDP-N-acetylmuramoyl-tripeptide--D-alanyl-D-alanine ligase [Desulfitibacter alkalitolerans]|uniref:UDP-N-acetylmuramoyl-tripeptide--D-alanyl-D- alanine ligase n=1 Tax=Desulfitibacter alkalitolerans TaxID=264641 RepID=UPI000486220F|nr:UDP-N-acetylmuramoyl-tripeptide--D-alanyl-D-alanine ligase [Desulfitibacter alkalitolerans]
MKVQEIAKIVFGELINETKAAIDIKKVSTDTRTISEGDLFIPLIGERFNGHDFLASAQERGACAVFAQKSYWQEFKPNLTMPVILVDDTLKALQDLAHYHRSKYNIPVIAITGSNGKTSTKDIIAAVLHQKLNIVKSQGSFNNEIGLPLTLLEINSATQAVVVEMGMRGLGQINELAGIARPTIGVVTNVAPVHIELLKTIDNIASAKGELVRNIGKSGKVFLNGEDPWCIKMKDWTEAEVNFYGFNNSCRYQAQAIEMNFYKSKFKLIINGQTKDMELQLPGKHNILNSLAAVGVAYELGFDLESISQGLKTAVISEKRLEKITLDNGVILVNDTYNANPISMKASIDILSAAKGARRVAVLGDMYELGEYEKEGHLAVGKHVCHNGVDLLITIGKLGKFIAQGALDSGMTEDRIYSFADNHEAAEFLKKSIAQGDTVLFKGSRAAKIEEIVKQLI